jgi:DNA helicase HerA-like ATPase
MYRILGGANLGDRAGMVCLYFDVHRPARHGADRGGFSATGGIMGDSGLFLGHDLDSRSRVGLAPDHLTTHAVCVGMTGSGKTGLGIVALEELARRRIPLLVIDLKGDMVNLLLNFPSLAGGDFEPWLTRDAVAGRSRTEAGEEQARRWREGLEGAGLDPRTCQAVRRGGRRR